VYKGKADLFLCNLIMNWMLFYIIRILLHLLSLNLLFRQICTISLIKLLLSDNEEVNEPLPKFVRN
jgi:hypothetical protein